MDKLERRAEEQGFLDADSFQEKLNAIFDDQDWSKVTEIGVFEEYFGEEGRLNVTERLTYLFPLLDRYPEDGKISFQELDVWNRRQALDRLIYSTERQLKLHDKDNDGAVTLEEFLSHISKEEIGLHSWISFFFFKYIGFLGDVPVLSNLWFHIL